MCLRYILKELCVNKNKTNKCVYDFWIDWKYMCNCANSLEKGNEYLT